MAIEYQCQSCGGIVVQLVDGRGLPERAGTCPWCEERTAEAIDRLRRRDDEERRRRRPGNAA